MKLISKELQDLVTWTYTPDGERLPGILEAMTDADLMIAFTHLKAEPAGRIAWAEYGRRQGFVNFGLKVVEADGQVNVVFEGAGLPVHHGAIKDV